MSHAPHTPDAGGPYRMPPRLLLAPMEGLVDHTLRDILTRAGGIDRCVSEFIRVTGTLLPERVFLRIVPELTYGCRTPSGVPVRPQLMGSDAACLADNAARLAGMGAEGIDLNFGCPAKIVNRHGGGAVLLQQPELLATIVAAVRRSVPAAVPVSAKMRLGYEDASRALECAQAIADAGAGELVVHARTKSDGYRPPAYWERIAEIRDALVIPVIANGEIWTADDADRCRARSGCEALMLGRGMVADPGLALAIRATVPRSGGRLRGCDDDPARGLAWPQVLVLMHAFWLLVGANIEPRARAGRLKQWLHYLRRRYVQADVAFTLLRTVNDPVRVAELLFPSPPAGTEPAPGPTAARRDPEPAECLP
jgi:tRNA-dihydrouridine synthase C